MIQCVQRGRSTSCSVSHFCDVISTSVAVTPSAGRSRATFHEKFASGAATYRSSAVCPDCARAVAGWGGAGTASANVVDKTASRTRRRSLDEVRSEKREGDWLIGGGYHSPGSPDPRMSW